MPHILVLNPNTNTQTTQMMVRLVQAQLPAHYLVSGVTAQAGASLITTPQALAVAAQQVPVCWQQAQTQHPWDGVLLACFADPALQWLRSATGVPTVGIGEAAMLAASRSGQRFGIATTTPQLDAAMHTQAQALGLVAQYTGARYTECAPALLVAQPHALQEQLHTCVQQCVQADGAQTVIIGGGPLGQAAQSLSAQTTVPLIAPLTAAAQWLQHALGTTAPASGLDA